mgnify:CR=1 FL=1
MEQRCLENAALRAGRQRRDRPHVGHDVKGRGSRRQAHAVRMRAVVARRPVLVVGPVLGVVDRFLVAVLAVGVRLVLGGRHDRFVMYLAVAKLPDDHLHGGGAVADEQQGRNDGTEAHGT